MVKSMRNAVRPYAWGSRTAIAALLGREVPAPHPEAELWLGAHPGDPSMVIGADGIERSLLDLVATDPVGQLGPDVLARWGTRLPFLLKVLAAEEPLSLQAHPSPEQAAAGFAREEAAGIPRDAANRNYPDPTAKPELLCALTEFHALAGFRDPHRTVKLLHAVETSGIAPYVDLLAAQPNSHGLRALFTTWITLPQPALDKLEPELLDACVAHVREHGEFELECRTILQLGEAYPGDAGVLAAMLLNRVVLAPGEAIFLPAGNLHSYLQGTGVEILANSDNVLRGGLTPKHVDVPELLRVLDFTPTDESAIRPEIVGDGIELVYDTPAPEFAVSVLRLDRDRLGHEVDAPARHDGPQILLCTEGGVTVHAKSNVLTLEKGAAAWVAADDGPIRLVAEQPTKLFRVTVGI
jgi:mannose-6-phosphate isomerase